MGFKSKNEILHFRPEDQDAVKDLILSGLSEHWGTIDPTKNPDLDDIALTYQSNVFLVARVNGNIVGTGALIHRSQVIAEIVRMSIAKEFRRQGIGRQILNQLVDMARDQGYNKVILETTETWHDVIEFYLRFGFQITHYQEGDVYFELSLR